jgi:hypothetical protein
MQALKILSVTTLSLVLLLGCSAPKKLGVNDGKSKEDISNDNKKDQSPSNLNTCLYEANALVKINRTYQKKVNELHNAIKDAKYYATISSNVTENIRETITPLYKFKINDICNDISQSVLNELKNGIEMAKDKVG